MSDREIAKLIEKISKGDESAENVLFKHYEKPIELIVRSRLPRNTRQDDVKDIVSDVQIALLKALRAGHFDPSKSTSLASYICGIAYYQIGQYFRKKGRNPEISIEEKKTDPVEEKSWIDEIVSDEEKKQLRKKLARLKSLYKDILYLCFYENMSVEDIAKTLKLDKKKVIDAKYNALKKLARGCKKEDFLSIFSILLQIYM